MTTSLHTAPTHGWRNRLHVEPLTRGLGELVAFTAALVGIGALFGAWGLLSDPEALGIEESWLAGSPFDSYTVPGLVLLVVIGGGMLLTAFAAIVEHRLAALAAGVMGIVLLVWGTVETLVVGYQGWPQLLLLGVFVAVPAALLLWAAWRSIELRR